MQRTGDSLFTKEVFLEKSRQYDHKCVANDWGWLWSFDNSELDGHVTDFSGQNPAPAYPTGLRTPRPTAT